MASITGYTTAGDPVVAGSGSPLGVVTPSRVGIIYVDTAQTNGGRQWISTGLTNQSWVVTSGDTGWLDVTASALQSSWVAGVTSPACAIRRIGNMIATKVRVSPAASLVGTTRQTTRIPVLSTPTGFTYGSYELLATAAIGLSYAGTINNIVARSSLDAYLSIGGSWASSDVLEFAAFYPTDDVWPTGVLP